jgi:tetratricopeptide (TPR) repeat protein
LRQCPGDSVARAHTVDLLERLGDTERAVAQLEQWSLDAPADVRGSLALRAARLEAAAGRRSAARTRIENLLAGESALDEAWIELTALARADGGPAAALALAERALEKVRSPWVRMDLLAAGAQALHELGRCAEAAARARELLARDPKRLDAASLLARNLPQAGDWADAVQKLEAALAAAQPDPALAAELWEAVGRAYAGPLENLPSAASAYRRALTANPLRQSAREALADITAFDPSSHGESLRLHLELLASFPARQGSWRALHRIAAHGHRDAAERGCAAVLAAFDARPAVAAQLPLRIHSEDAQQRAERAAREALRACERTRPAIRGAEGASLGPLPESIQEGVARLAGRAWTLPDSLLAHLWHEAAAGDAPSGRPSGGRLRLQFPRGQRSSPPAWPRELRAESWRAELLAEASALALDAGRIGLRENLLSLLAAWPATAQWDLSSAGDLAPAIQECPPARTLLLRIADAVAEALPPRRGPRLL